MKIRITGQAGEENFPFRNSGPWELFEQEILSQGHQICSSGFKERADAVIANSYTRKLTSYMNKMNIPIERRTLVVWEPFIVDSKNYKIKNTKQFGQIYAPSVVWADKLSGKSFKWPQDEILDTNCFSNWSNRKNIAIMIQGNKFSASRGELYSIRRKTIKTFAPDEMNLFGTNWNKGLVFDFYKWLSSATATPVKNFSAKSIVGIGSNYENYQGSVSNKSNTLQQYRIALVIENSLDFVSEKLFDALRSGCIVIYVGPKLDLFGIPKGAAFEVAAKPEEIWRKFLFLEGLSTSEQLSIAKSQREALASVAENWKNVQILPNLAHEILKNLNS